MRLTCTALAGMAIAGEIAANPDRAPGRVAEAGSVLVRAMATLELASRDVPVHRATGDVMTDRTD